MQVTFFIIDAQRVELNQKIAMYEMAIIVKVSKLVKWAK
jgi:hypothetical protein